MADVAQWWTENREDFNGFQKTSVCNILVFMDDLRCSRNSLEFSLFRFPPKIYHLFLVSIRILNQKRREFSKQVC